MNFKANSQLELRQTRQAALQISGITGQGPLKPEHDYQQLQSMTVIPKGRDAWNDSANESA